MSFDAIRGQSTAIETLTRALSSGYVHHAYRFEGIDGVGKERTAMAFAQALLCTAGEPHGCGRCDACRRVVETGDADPPVPLHPDVVLLGRGLYPAEVVGKKEIAEISVQQVRKLVLARAAYGPHEGRAQVFIVRDAEQLSISAANALLKTLEEPRPDTHFVLLTSRPEQLIDTIRSRTLPVRFGPLPDEVVADVLREAGIDDDRIPTVVEMAAGSAGTALEGADPELSEARERFVSRMLAAAEAPHLAEAVRLAEEAPTARGELVDQLGALAAHYVRAARSAGEADAERCARRHELVLDAIDAVEQRNATGKVAVAALVASLRHGWQRRPGTKPPIVVQRR